MAKGYENRRGTFLLYLIRQDTNFVMQRQFQRTTEMLIQRSLPEDDEEALKRYRLQVKERLYRFNFVRPQNLFRRSCILTRRIGAADAVRER